MEQDPNEIFLFDGKHHVVKMTAFGEIASPITVKPPSYRTLLSNVSLDFPKIPYDLFMMICKWQTEIAAKHSCETSCSLFLIENRTKWVAFPFFQENTTQAMTIKTNFEDERNAALLTEFGDQSPVHSTLHNHVKAGAGQSGTDFDDEKNLPGPHMTIGNLDQKQMTFHARLSVFVDGKQTFIPMRFTDIIDVPVPPGASLADKDAIAKLYLNFDRTQAPPYPEEWADRFQLKTYQTTTVYGHKIHDYGTHRPYQPNLSILGNEDEEFESAWEKYERQKQEKQEEEWKDLSQILDEIPVWPLEPLLNLPLESQEAFEKALDKCSPMVKEGAISICLRAKIGYKGLYEMLVETNTKLKNPMVPETNK